MVQGLLGRGINTKSGGALGEHGLASAVKEACVAALKDVRGLLAAQYSPEAWRGRPRPVRA
jgi:hypothetical protein